MDCRLLSLFVLPLGTCPAPQVHTLHSLVEDVPVHEWPNRSEHPEPAHPAHGEGSGDPPFTVGIAASGIFTNVTAQQIWFTSEPACSTPERFFADQFLAKTNRNVTLRVQPQQGKRISRDTIPRRTVGARSGR